jgi:hypothetical protein
MNLQAIGERWNVLHVQISSILIAVRCIARGLFLFVAVRPQTPLRVLCIMAFDTLYLLRNSKPLPMSKLRMLVVLLDFEACANAALDNKKSCPHECCETLQLLEEAEIKSSLVEYRRRLGNLENSRPLPGGDHWQFRKIALYREAVVRLSLGMVAATVHDNHCLDEGILATYYDADVNILFRIAMQCQIIDDVLDYSKDMAAGLPSFLTACKSLPQAFELTRLAATAYADDRDLPQAGDLFPLQSALFLVTTCTKLVIILDRWKQRNRIGQQFTVRLRGRQSEA